MAQTGDYELGIARFEKGDAVGAVALLKRAAEGHPRDAQMQKALGVAYAALNDFGAAEPALRRACELDPKLPDACYFQARALYGLDRFAESLKALEKADGRSWKVVLARAEALEGMGAADRAERPYRESVAICGGRDPGPAIALGKFLARQGRMAEAMAPVEEAVRRFPSSAEGHTLLGRGLLESGKVTEAIGELERAVSLAPTSGQAQLLLAKALVRAGRASEAESHFEAAAKYGK